MEISNCASEYVTHSCQFYANLFNTSTPSFGTINVSVGQALESERADRRSSILQLVNLNAIATVGFLNAGITLSLNGT